MNALTWIAMGLWLGFVPAVDEPFLRLEGVPERLRFPLPEGTNQLLTVTVEGGNAREVWLAASKEAKGRVMFNRSGSNQYQVNLADPLVLAVLNGSRVNSFQVFAQMENGTLLGSVPVRYTKATASVAETKLLIHLDSPSHVIDSSSKRSLWLQPGRLKTLEVQNLPTSEGTAKAAVGEQSWPFTPAADKAVHRLEITPALRARWQASGRLTIAYGPNDSQREVTLHAPPSALVPEPVTVSVPQRKGKDVPGTNGYLRVEIDDITAGQVVLTLRTADGRCLIDSKSVKEGEEIGFRYEGESYCLTVVRLVNHLVDEDVGFFTIGRKTVSHVQQIERLIERVKSSGLAFFREGKTYTAVEAAEHLRTKGEMLRPMPTSVEDFIERAGSRSALTGEDYWVRLPDGTKSRTGVWLREQAKLLETSATPQRP